MKLINSLALSIVLIFLAFNVRGNSQLRMADPKASPATMRLLSKMKELSAQGIMIGHQDDMAYGIGWKAPNGQSDVYKVCADYPAVFGWDLAGLESGSKYNIDSVPFRDMLKYAKDVHLRGGINTFSWHCNNPLTGGSAWDINTPGVVKSILSGGIKHGEFNLWLDNVATFLSALKDEKGEPIPIIFRPYHEQTGNWFWWGKAHCTSEEFRQLWAYTFKYLTETKNIHNLIFAFSTGGSFANVEEYSDRYPGDEYVDIVGFDLYQEKDQANNEFAEKLTGELNILFDFAKAKNKLAALTEIGNEQIPYPEWWTKVFYPVVKNFQLSYALFWRNAADRPNHYYMPYPGHKSEGDFRNFYNLPGTLFLKDIGKQKIYN
ncbi:MAG TPA: glycosyl hydrolase [Bacteroidales bacterium]